MNKCPPGTCKGEVNLMVARRIASQAVEAALKSALAEVRRSGDADNDTIISAVSEGLKAAKPLLDAISKD